MSLTLLMRYGLPRGAAPEPPPATLEPAPDGIWLESLLLTGLSNDDDVTVWPDASAAEYDLDSVRTHPKYITNETPAGAPAVYSVNTPVTGPDVTLQGFGSFYTDDTEPFTLFMVHASASSRADASLVSIRETGAPWRLSQGFTSGSDMRFRRAGTNTGSLAFTGTYNDDTWRLITICFDPSRSTERLRGWVGGTLNADANEATVTAHPTNPLTVFSGFNNTNKAAGKIAALLWYRSALSDTDREDVWDYLDERYITP